MRKLILTLIALALIAPSVSEAGLFRRRNGERRAPVRNTLKAGGRVFGGGCSNGACSR